MIYQLGIRRSGNHAISNWLFPMLGEFIYINNIDLGKINDNDIVKKGNFNALLTFENVDFIDFHKYIAGTDLSKRILVVREPLNLLASTWITYKFSYQKISEAIHYYEQYTMFMGTVILYDEWLTSEDYRREIAKRLGLEFNDANFSKVFGYGKSHFDDDNRRGRYCDDLPYKKDLDVMFDKEKMINLYTKYQQL